MAKKKNLAGDLIDLTVGAAIALPTFDLLGTSVGGSAGTVLTGTQTLVGVALLKKSSKL